MSNKVIKSKTRKPTLKDKVKGSFNCIVWMLESLVKGDFEDCKFAYVLLKETIKEFKWYIRIPPFNTKEDLVEE